MPKPQLTANTVRNAETAIAAWKQKKPNTVAEARTKSIELIRLNRILDDARRQPVAAPIANVSNGKVNGGAYLTVKAHNATVATYDANFDQIMQILEAVGTAYQKALDRIAALEQKPSMKYEGVWDLAKIYQPGDCITADGSMWTCVESNINTEPPASCWKLCVKRGRDGRDRR